MKTWLKGGLIGTVILLIYSLTSLFFIGFNICGFITECIGENCWDCLIFEPFLAVILGFIMGSIIGLIIQKIRK